MSRRLRHHHSAKSAAAHAPATVIVIVTIAIMMVAMVLTTPDAIAQNNGAKAKNGTHHRKRQPGVRGMFDAAQEHYDAGHYPEALQAYWALLRRYPAYEPAGIQVAKTLYRMERMKDAYQAFSRLPPQHLDAETSYEYGYAFYANKVWDGAVYGFQRVPQGHALYDLANYYGGLSAIKLRRYEDAADMLEKSVVLPDKLAKSRALYIKHVQALLLLQQRNALAQERDKERETLAQENSRRRAAPHAEGPVPNKPPPAPVDPLADYQGFQRVKRQAVLKYTSDQQNLDYFGYQRTTYDAKIASFDFKSGLLLPLPVKSPTKDRQAAFGLQLTMGAEDRVKRGRSQRLLYDHTNEDLVLQFNKDLGTTDLKQGILGALTWMEFPLPSNMLTSAGFEANFYFPDFGRNSRQGSARGFYDLGMKTPTFKVLAEAAYTEIIDPRSKPTTSISSGNIEVAGEVLPKLTLSSKVSAESYQYHAEGLQYDNTDNALIYLDGPDTTAGIEFKAKEELPFGATIELLGAFQNQSNYIFHTMPTYGQLGADAQISTAKASLTIRPPIAPFLSASVSQLLAKTVWKQQNAAASTTFETTVPNYVEDFTAWVSLDLWL